MSVEVQKDALDYLIGTGKKLAGVKQIHLPGNKTMIVMPDGASETYDGDERQRTDTVSTLSSFIDWCGENQGTLEVFVRPHEITARVNFEKIHQTQVCILPLNQSEAWKTLQAWSKNFYPQKEVVRLLRGVLHDTFELAHLQAFRNIDFKRTNDGKRSLDHGRESLGKSVEQAVQSSSGTIPEMMAFTVPMFDFEGSPTVTLKLAVDINLEAETFQLMPMGNTFTLAVRAALNDLQGRLKAALTDAPVYLSQ